VHDRVTLPEALGLLPLRERLRQARIALGGAPHVPPSRWDTSSLALVQPRLGWPLWRGRWVVPRRVILTNLFNHAQTPVEQGWSVRRTSVLDFRGKGSTYDSHNGTDLCVPVGTTVVAPAPGVVVRVWSEFHRGGLKVAIDHGGGLVTSSAHLARALVRPGQRLAAGEPFALSGYAGLDGFVTFPLGVPHVHFNVWLDGVPVDPFARTGETSLWRGGVPRPPTEPGPPPAPSDWDDAAVLADLDACLHAETRAALRAIVDPVERAGSLVAERNYYPTRFPTRPSLLRAPAPRAERLCLPFRPEDVDGAVFADER
jgi:murein DD-endopeptidase MepM/ murein hydrolase activator NlpD